MEPYSEDRIEKLAHILPLIARWAVAGGQSLDSDAVSRMVSEARFAEEEWMRAAVRLIHSILACSADASDSERSNNLKELESLGFSYATAFLALDSAAQSPNRQGQVIPHLPAVRPDPGPTHDGTGRPALSVSPSSLDFGILQDGEGAAATLDVSGELMRTIVSDQRLEVTIGQSHGVHSLLHVRVVPGSAGETLSVSLVLVGPREQLLVPIVAGWQKDPRRAVASTSAPVQRQMCPLCGHNSLFWMRHRFDCLNPACRAEGQSPHELKR